MRAREAGTHGKLVAEMWGRVVLLNVITLDRSVHTLQPKASLKHLVCTGKSLALAVAYIPYSRNPDDTNC